MHDMIFFQNALRKSPDAIAVVKGSAAYPKLRGTVQLRQLSDGVLLTSWVQGLPQGSGDCPANVFGFHIHEGKSCTGNNKDPFADAGTHFNPKNCPHPAHAGDLPPLFGNRGDAYLSFFTDRFTVAQVIGRTVIIHSHPDDFKSQPAGDSGEKIACGVIQRSSFPQPRPGCTKTVPCR